MRKSSDFTLIDQNFESSQDEEMVNIFEKTLRSPTFSFAMTTPSTKLGLSGRSSFHNFGRTGSPVEQSESAPSLVLQPPTPISNVAPSTFSFKKQSLLNSSASLARLSTFSFDSYGLQREHSVADQTTQKTPEMRVFIHHSRKVIEIDAAQLDKMRPNCVLVDCRWPYEFEGGSIEGAINCHDAERLVELVLTEQNRGKTIVFFCEYSEVRGPKMARFLTKYCIKNEVDGFKDIYVLKGGFHAFYQKGKRDLTGGYVIEKDITHINEMRQYSGNGRYDMNIPLEYQE